MQSLTTRALRKFRPHFLKIGVVVAPQHLHAVHANGRPALMVSTFAELNKEMGQDHFLYGKKIWAAAKCESNDDVLYVLRNGMGRDIYYLVHLTYSAHNADGFPQYEEFADLFAVKEFIERSYIEDYM